MPNDPQATKVHGITDEHVKDAKTFGQLAKEVKPFFPGHQVTIGGYNVIGFNIKVLAYEMDWVGVPLIYKPTIMSMR